MSKKKLSLRSATSIQILRRSVTLFPLFCNQLRILLMKHQFELFDLGNTVSAQSLSTNEPTRVRKGGHLCHVLGIIKIGDVLVRSDAGRGDFIVWGQDI